MLFQKRNCSYNPQERAALQQDSSKMLSFQLFPVFFCFICNSSFWLSTIKTNMEVICSKKNLRMVGFSLQTLRTQGLPVHLQRRSSNVLHVSKKKKITLFWITHILGFPLYQSVTTWIGDCIDSLQWEARQVPNKLNKHPAWFLNDDILQHKIYASWELHEQDPHHPFQEQIVLYDTYCSKPWG